MIKLTDLTFQYPGSPSPVLKGINLQIPSGTLALVTGPSGSGKSTFLRCLNGLVPHFTGGQISGSIEVMDMDPVRIGPEGMSSQVGIVFQEPEAQFVFDTVEDEIAFSLENHEVPREESRNRLDEVCQFLDLESIRTKPIHQISGGEKQRVAVAGALVNRPQVLILDEPTSQLDPRSADDLLRYIVSLKDSLGLTIIIAEHRLERLLPYADLMINLTPEGKCISGSPQEVLAEMELVPPIIAIARKYNLSPLPLTVDSFPKIGITESKRQHGLFEQREIQDQKLCLQVNNLSASLGGPQILKQIDLQIHSDEIVALLGPNGAGKTTLLRAIVGLIPYEGEILLWGNPIQKGSLREIIKRVGYLPQNPSDLLFAETVLDELKITLRNHGMTRSDDDLEGFLSGFGLSKHRSDYPRDLSIGERQRTALASITVHSPDLILMDEPTRGLDYQNKDKLIQHFKKWRSQNKGILVVTHDVEFAARLADRVIILEHGRIIFSGSPIHAFHNFPGYETQTARLFPENNWITPEDVSIS